MIEPVTAAILGSAALSAGGNILGGMAQGRAISRAQDKQQEFQNRLLGFQERVFGEGAQFRTLARSLLPQLQSELAQPTLSRGFSRASERLNRRLAATGNLRSGAAAIGQAELGALERERNLSRLVSGINLGAGVGQRSTGQAASLFGPAAGVTSQIANLGVSGGAVEGGTFGALGNTGSQALQALQLQQFLGGLKNVTPGG
jgi:hypothetical protein